MAILPIYTYDARVLREKTHAVERPDEAIALALDMFETMRNAHGVGLAANQVGRGLSVFTIDLTEVEGYEETKPLLFINPDITDFDGDDVAYEEGCLSIPSLREDVVRPERLRISYRDANFDEQVLEADGFLARVIQHEFDHLEGIFFTDRLRGLRKRLVVPALQKIKRGETPADYPLADLKKMDIIA